jgi:8-oxo-dGTP diphosphatase
LVREVREETSLILKSYIYRAKLLFVNDTYREVIHLFTSKDFVGDLNENCDEGDLSWVDKNKINEL